MNRKETLSAVNETWQELKDAIALVPNDRLDETGVVGFWSVKDLIGHVTTWEKEALQALCRHVNDSDTRALAAWPDDLDGFNAREVEGKKGTGLAQLRRELDDTHSRIVELLATLGEAEFLSNEVKERIRIDTYDHYADHAGQILRWLDASGAIRQKG